MPQRTLRPGPPLRRRSSRALVAISLAVLAACSNTANTSTPPVGGSVPGSAPAGTTTGTSATTGTSLSRSSGPSADLSEEITGPGKPFMGEASGTGLPAGYEEHEFVASGTATSYRAPTPPPADGRWSFTPGTTAAYRTRVIVRRPTDPTKFSGTAVVEWLNVSGGVDANPDYSSLVEEIVRKGHVWVGVSAQLIGVEGGPVLVAPPGVEAIVGKGLKKLDPARYGSLAHPGDGFSFDMFTQVARAVRDGGAGVGGLKPEVVLAAGESQSAIALTTYYDGVRPLTRAFDGFFVHSRAFAPLPLVEPGKYADLAGSMSNAPAPVLLRDDVDAPVLELQTEGDVIGVLNSITVRQPDTNRFRLWEIAGGSHADVHLIGQLASAVNCGVPINNGATHIVAKAALRALDTWVRTQKAPPTAPRLDTTSADKPAIVRNGDGIATGGIRTPPVDVPVDVLSGEPGPSSDLICILMGSTKPLAAARLAELYPSRASYEQKFGDAADATIKAGFALPEDREALLGFAQPSRLAG